MAASSPASKATPPLKWAGGKRWLVPTLSELWKGQAHRRLVEPFCGGLAVALGLRPQRALLNDVNPHLVNFYRQLQQGLSVDLAMENDSEQFYAHRERFNALIAEGKSETPEAAQLFYYLNRTGFNGLCRFNKSGFFNVPFGRYANINYPSDFLPFQEVFAEWDFQLGDFDQLDVKPEDFLYADPPYDVEFTQYSSGGFDWDDQVRLAHWLAQHPGPVALSNQLTPRIEELYRDLGFDLLALDGPRRISCNGDRSPAKEVLATRNL
ncbi:DNA adenine methylase [Roseibacillus persicicus]|uniref:DNA adenine methylase n=1 Tax=Roseibacillus persicicus TaxID=454148 RepID=UPI00280E4515|nr:Dam family site-specific DNA-(adenine-N6)-methyltransferase [Roseibacillus persicicus]MDQ8190329.1 Dam family site-specific DNA-(adenine-N6)-methyltransferase [Roseibacillus persicicus]